MLRAAVVALRFTTDVYKRACMIYGVVRVVADAQQQRQSASYTMQLGIAHLHERPGLGWDVRTCSEPSSSHTSSWEVVAEHYIGHGTVMCHRDPA